MIRVKSLEALGVRWSSSGSNHKHRDRNVFVNRTVDYNVELIRRAAEALFQF